MYMYRVSVGADFAAYFRLLYVEMLILHLDTDYLRAKRTWKLLILSINNCCKAILSHGYHITCSTD